MYSFRIEDSTKGYKSFSTIFRFTFIVQIILWYPSLFMWSSSFSYSPHCLEYDIVTLVSPTSVSSHMSASLSSSPVTPVLSATNKKWSKIDLDSALSKNLIRVKREDYHTSDLVESYQDWDEHSLLQTQI